MKSDIPRIKVSVRRSWHAYVNNGLMRASLRFFSEDSFNCKTAIEIFVLECLKYNRVYEGTDS